MDRGGEIAADGVTTYSKRRANDTHFRKQDLCWRNESSIESFFSLFAKRSGKKNGEANENDIKVGKLFHFLRNEHAVEVRESLASNSIDVRIYR